ncbi:MAG: AsmA family protein [bacterium]
MHFFRKLIIWIAIVLASLVFLAFIATTLLMNRFKPRLEELITRNIGYETRIDGRLALKLMPGMSVIVGDIKVISHETYLFSASEIEMAINYVKIFNGEISVESLLIVEPQAYVVKNESGIFNYEKLYAQVNPTIENKDHRQVVLNLREILIRDGHIRYLDNQNNDTLELSGIHFLTDNLAYQGTFEDINPKAIDLKGNLSIDHLKMNSLQMDSLVLIAESNNGVINLREKRRGFLGGKVIGQAKLDFNQKPVYTELVHQVNGMSVAQFLRMINSDEYLDGNINYTLNLNFQSLDGKKARETLRGSLEISGQNLTFYGLDLDKKLQQFKVTSRVDLWETAALFIAGPYGPSLLRGLDYSTLLRDYVDEQTHINQLFADWEFNNGIASAEDVAFSTPKFRISAAGALDLSQSRFRNFTLSMVDRKGCAILSQTLNGSFAKPGTSSFALRGLEMKSTEDIIRLMMSSTKEECTPVYRGSVSHPGG